MASVRSQLTVAQETQPLNFKLSPYHIVINLMPCQGMQRFLDKAAGDGTGVTDVLGSIQDGVQGGRSLIYLCIEMRRYFIFEEAAGKNGPPHCRE